MTKLHQERDCYEETMKKAFMRGVCALNLDSMIMFQPQDDQRPEPGILSCFFKYIYTSSENIKFICTSLRNR